MSVAPSFVRICVPRIGRGVHGGIIDGKEFRLRAPLSEQPLAASVGFRAKQPVRETLTPSVAVQPKVSVLKKEQNRTTDDNNC